MKCVGETMAIGAPSRRRCEKALRGLEVGSFGLGSTAKTRGAPRAAGAKTKYGRIRRGGRPGVWCLRDAMKYGMSIEEIYELTAIDPWFLENLKEIVEMEEHLQRSADCTR